MAFRVLDTNIVSFLMKRHPLAVRYRPHIVGYDLAISFQTLAELYAGGRLADWSQRRWDELDDTIRDFSILQSDESVSVWWAEIRAVRKAQPIAVADCWIAATAVAYGLELVTHNPADFAGIPWLTVLSEAP